MIKEPSLFSSAILLHLHNYSFSILCFRGWNMQRTHLNDQLNSVWLYTPTNPYLGVPSPFPRAWSMSHLATLSRDGRPRRLKSRPSSFFDFPLLWWYSWLKNCWILRKHSFCYDTKTFFQCGTRMPWLYNHKILQLLVHTHVISRHPLTGTLRTTPSTLARHGTEATISSLRGLRQCSRSLTVAATRSCLPWRIAEEKGTWWIPMWNCTRFVQSFSGFAWVFA